jgi:DNA-binding transcriptional MerR regulator
MDKCADAFRTISEVAEELRLPQHVLRFWESRFTQIKPLKRGGGRRYYRPRDIEILRAIKHLLYAEGYTIKGVQRVLKEQGIGALGDGPSANSETCPDVPRSSEDEVHRSRGTTPWQGERAGVGAETALTRPSAELRDASGGDIAASIVSERAMWSLRLKTEDVARLRTALAELAECENILAAVRHR